jgi:group I intron endonuclease
MNGIVYRWTSPSGKSYIGSTSDEKKRMSQHKACCGNSAYFHSAIKKYGWINFKYEVLVSGINSRHEMLRIESEEIKKQNTVHPNGYNAFAEYAEQCGLARYKKNNDKNRNAVVRIEDGAEFSSMRAAMIATGASNIMKVIDNPNKTSGGFHWVRKKHFTGNEVVNERSFHWRCKMVRCKDTGIIYKSAADAGRKNNIPRAVISQCCLGTRKLAAGLRWEFV